MHKIKNNYTYISFENLMDILIVLLFYLVHIFKIYNVRFLYSKIFSLLLLKIKSEKCHREEFLVKYEVEIESKNMNNLLSILVPKFVKVLMNQGINS